MAAAVHPAESQPAQSDSHPRVPVSQSFQDVIHSLSLEVVTGSDGIFSDELMAQIPGKDNYGAQIVVTAGAHRYDRVRRYNSLRNLAVPLLAVPVLMNSSCWDPQAVCGIAHSFQKLIAFLRRALNSFLRAGLT